MLVSFIRSMHRCGLAIIVGIRLVSSAMKGIMILYDETHFLRGRLEVLKTDQCTPVNSRVC